jgi:hypothetical protein
MSHSPRLEINYHHHILRPTVKLLLHKRMVASSLSKIPITSINFASANLFQCKKVLNKQTVLLFKTLCQIDWVFNNLSFLEFSCRVIKQTEDSIFYPNFQANHYNHPSKTFSISKNILAKYKNDWSAHNLDTNS